MSDNESEQISDIAQARKRIKQLEAKLTDAIDLVVKRDDQLSVYERRIMDLEELVEKLQNK